MRNLTIHEPMNNNNREDPWARCEYITRGRFDGEVLLGLISTHIIRITFSSATHHFWILWSSSDIDVYTPDF